MPTVPCSLKKVDMNTRNLPIVFLFLLVSISIVGQNAEKTLVRAFNLQGNQEILLDIDGAVEIQSWNQEQMRIMMTISLAEGSELMLKNLVKIGRYNLTAEETTDGLTISAPALGKQVKLRDGSEFNEIISMVVYAPNNVSVKTRTTESVPEN